MNAEIVQSGTVVLVHGIRTHAPWFQHIRADLENAGYKVHLTNYGRFDLFRFLMPISFFRRRAQEKLYRQLRDVLKDEGTERPHIIAHSFGTYLVSNILRGEFDLSLGRIIFVGSVVRYDFSFEQFAERFEGEILNEVGVRDIWPVMAQSVTIGYGATGTFGFKRPRVYDQWHPGAHSDVLTAKHCKRNWIPFLKTGEPVFNKQCALTAPWWIRLLDVLRLKYVFAALLCVAIIFMVLVSLYRNNEELFSFKDTGDGWTLDQDNRALYVNELITETCPFRQLYGPRCESSFVYWITGRTWAGLEQFASDLKSVRFIGDYQGRFRDPWDFYHDLARTYPNCLMIESGQFGNRILLDPSKNCEDEGNQSCVCERSE